MTVLGQNELAQQTPHIHTHSMTELAVYVRDGVYSDNSNGIKTEGL